jgi:hypothetical protein
MATKKQLEKVAEQHGATVTSAGRLHKGWFEACVRAPLGKHWAYRGVHTLTELGDTASEAYDRVIQSMQHGLVDCFRSDDACVEHNGWDGGEPLATLLADLTDDQIFDLMRLATLSRTKDAALVECIQTFSLAPIDDDDSPRFRFINYGESSTQVDLYAGCAIEMTVNNEPAAAKTYAIWVLEYFTKDELEPLKDAVLAGEVRWLMDSPQSTP